MRDDVIERLREVASRVAGSHGLDLFDLQFRRESPGWVLRVVLDRRLATGTGDDLVGIEDCRLVSHDLSAILDVEEEALGLGDRAYTLEVSSPGLDRPLRGEADYRRFEGRLAKIVTSEPVAGQTYFEGRLAGIDGGDVLVAHGARLHRVPVNRIRRARLEVEF
ncbi:MAG TPA: ribosome maturation factor RimP [Vicinamibacterales bacterium]|nr:ribosome maturation factor RimP [Vicinamibacterales bacterium]